MTRSRRDMGLWVGSLFCGVALAALTSPLHAADVRGNNKNQGKVGDRCNSSSDCARSPVALRCLPAGEHKQCAEAPRTILPPT